MAGQRLECSKKVYQHLQVRKFVGLAGLLLHDFFPLLVFLQYHPKVVFGTTVLSMLLVRFTLWFNSKNVFWDMKPNQANV